MIDNFLVTIYMAQGSRATTVNYNSGLSPHRPVPVRFQEQLTSPKARSLRKPPAIAATRAQVLMFRASGWQLVNRDATALYALAWEHTQPRLYRRAARQLR